MWKHKIDRADLTLNCTYKVEGLNLDRFINYLKKEGIALYNIKKLANNCLIVTVSFNQSQKFFAIAKKLCYNIKKVRDGGKALPLLKLYRMLGVFIGCVLIFVTTWLCDGLLLGVSYSGSGSLYQREVSAYLLERGIVPYTRFSNFSTQRLEDEILASNPHLTFVSCKKVGCRLVVQLELSKDKVGTLNGNVYSLVSNESGTIESLKVYRGTAVVSVGDKVQSGDLLVDGFAVIKEQMVKINVLASVTLICESEYNLTFDTDKERESALIFAEQQLFGKEIVDSVITISKNGQKFDYKVNMYYRHVLCVG